MVKPRASSSRCRASRLLCLRQDRLRRDELGFGGAQRVQFVLRVDPRHHLSGGDPVADGDPPLDQLAIDAKREIALFLGADLPGQDDLLGEDPVLDRDGPHRPLLRGRSRAGLAAGGEPRQGEAT